MALGYLDDRAPFGASWTSLKNSADKERTISAAWALGNMRAKDPEARVSCSTILDPNDSGWWYLQRRWMAVREAP